MGNKRKSVSKQERESVYRLCNGHCAYCGKKITMREMQVDHFLSHNIGGALDYNNLDTLDNYLPSCRSCNYRKSDMLIEDFRKNIIKLTDVLNRSSASYRDAVRFGQVTENKHMQEFYYEKIGVHIGAMDALDNIIERNKEN